MSRSIYKVRSVDGETANLIVAGEKVTVDLSQDIGQRKLELLAFGLVAVAKKRGETAEQVFTDGESLIYKPGRRSTAEQELAAEYEKLFGKPYVPGEDAEGIAYVKASIRFEKTRNKYKHLIDPAKAETTEADETNPPF